MLPVSSSSDALIQPGIQSPQPPAPDVVLASVGPLGFLRGLALRLLASRLADWFILGAIFVNSLTLGLEPVAPTNPTVIGIVAVTEPLFLAIFLMEVIVKLVALGLWQPRKAYFRSLWNCVDFTIIVFSLLSYLPRIENISVIRTLRVLRPLRSINRVPGLRLIMTALVASLPGLMDVFLLLLFLLLIFALFGIQVWTGALHAVCYLPLDGGWTMVDDTPCAMDMSFGWGRACDAPSVCMIRDYRRQILNFDTIGNAALLVLKVISTDDWPTEMNNMQNAWGQVAFVYFILVTILGSFFCVNLFLAILTTTFSTEAKNRRRGSAFIVDPDDDNADLLSVPDEVVVLPLKRIPGRMQWLAEHQFFQRTMLLVTFINIVLLSLDHYGNHWAGVIELCTLLCSLMFLIELVIKMLGLGPRTYLSDGYNIFDMLLVALSVIELAVVQSHAFNALRGFRVARVFRLAHRWTSLRQLLCTILHSLAGVGYLSLLTLLFIFIFTILGFRLYADVFPLDVRSSFRTSWQSAITVFVVLTGEEWSSIMQHAMVGTGNALTCFYFIILFTVGSYLLLNLFVAILVDSFGRDGSQDPPRPPPLKHAISKGVRALELQWVDIVDDPSFSPKSQRIAIGGVVNRIIAHPKFDTVVVAVVIANCVILALETAPRTHVAAWESFFRVCNIVFTILFVAEALLKVCGLGYKRYWASNWNRIDLFVAITAVVALFLPFFRLFRAWRTVRVAIRSDACKVVLAALIQAVPQITNLAVVCCFVFLVFGILGIQLFKGTFYSCVPEAAVIESDCAGEWQNAPFHFNHLGSAMMALFVVAVGDGWAGLMYTGMDSTEEHHAPSLNARPVVALYFIAFTVAGNFFMLNLFVGMLINKFIELKNDIDGSALMTPQQRHWVKAQRILRYAKVVRNTREHDLMYCIATSQAMDIVVVGLIVANIVLMCGRYWGQSQTVTNVLKWGNIFFVLAFNVEALIKIVGLRPRDYFSDPWCRFDFLIVAVSTGGLVVDGGVVSILRIFRVLRLIRVAKGLQRLLKTLWCSLPSLGNISFLLILSFFNFGVMGVQLFGDVLLGYGLHQNANFRTLGYAILTLYQVSTTETWFDVMNGCNLDPKTTNCQGDECGTAWATLYFVLFMIIGSFVMLNLFVTVVLEGFDEAGTDQLEIAQRCFDVFMAAWVIADKDGVNSLSTADFITFIANLPFPMGPPVKSRMHVLRTLHTLSIPLPRDMQITYLDALCAVTRKVFDVDITGSSGTELLRRLEAQDDSHAARHVRHNISASIFMLHHCYAAQIVVEFLQKRRHRTKIKSLSMQSPKSLTCDTELEAVAGIEFGRERRDSFDGIPTVRLDDSL